MSDSDKRIIYDSDINSTDLISVDSIMRVTGGDSFYKKDLDVKPITGGTGFYTRNSDINSIDINYIKQLSGGDAFIGNKYTSRSAQHGTIGFIDKQNF